MAVLLFAAAPAPPLQDLPLASLVDKGSPGDPLPSGQGLELEVDREAFWGLPLQGAQELEIDYQARGILLLTSATFQSGVPARPLAPPRRYRQLVEGRAATLRIDLLQAPGWSPESYPLLLFQGTGHVSFTGMRARPAPADPAQAMAARDRARLLAPFAVDHTTINLLDPPMWSVSTGAFFFDRLGLAFCALAAALALALLAMRRKWRPGPALAAAALIATAAGNALFLGKMVPAFDLSIEPDAGARIRRGYAFAPDLGALASLARATLRLDERVGVLGRPEEWFAWEMLCFNLAPRRCVRIAADAQELVGLSGVDRLRAADLDAVVSYNADAPLLPGFGPVAAVSRRAAIARRR